MDELLGLMSAERPVSGEWLSDRLGVTRGAVWKRVQKLRAEGYRVVSAGKLGYRLDPEPDSLLPGYIAAELQTRWAGRGQIAYARSMDSTNARLGVMAREGAPRGSLAVCEAQTAGRGRLQRRWETPEGEALTFSLLLRPDMPAERAPLCTLGAAVAAAQAARERCPSADVRVKWPNDLVAGGRKCAGILCEMSAGMDGVEHVVVGVGLNVNQRAFGGELADKATSLHLQTGARVCRRALLCACLRRMEDAVDALERDGLNGIRGEYMALSATIGARVRVVGAGGEFEGVAEALDDTGALLVRDTAGETRRVLSGDVSVRGLMGYC